MQLQPVLDIARRGAGDDLCWNPRRRQCLHEEGVAQQGDEPDASTRW